jgi:ribosomal protein L9
VGTAAKAKPGDIRVKMNIDVKNVGKKNEVVFVSASMFNNLLGPQKKASRVSDADNADNIMKAEEEAKKAFEKAEELKGKIEALKEQIIERNIGPDGTLFGVVAGKHVLEHLTKSAKLDIPAKATVKEMLAIDASGAVIETCAGAETKRGGTFIARVQLNEKVDLAAFGFSVEQKAK